MADQENNIFDTILPDDFGFSFVDETEYESQTKSLSEELKTTKESADDVKSLQAQINRIVEKQESVDTILENNTSRIEKKIDQLLNLTMEKIQSVITEHGSSMAELSDLICNSNNDELAEKYERNLKEKMKSIEQLFLPFLKGMTRDPDKEYIKWPNRKEVIEQKAKALIAITRS